MIDERWKNRIKSDQPYSHRPFDGNYIDVTFDHCTVTGCTFGGTFTDVTFNYCTFIGCTFSGTFTDVSFDGSSLARSSYVDGTFDDVTFTDTTGFSLRDFKLAAFAKDVILPDGTRYPR